MGTNRLESFSDGVMAVAITLLVLGIAVPNPNAHPYHSLVYELGRSWTQYVAYVISFLTIGIIWINHHAMISRLKEADQSILILNLLLLMSIGVLPFATSLMAEYLRSGHDEAVAAAAYSGALLVMSVLFGTLNRHILLERGHLMAEELPLSARRRILTQSASGIVPYVLAVGLAFVSAYATLVICGLIAVFYATPVASGRRRAA
ncbi:MAG TPA: TMEM175 family protein [Solirubrobacteraceae bacterium]|nr:TMEM175 family protein [Solirubrobacteraceae bacterium]